MSAQKNSEPKYPQKQAAPTSSLQKPASKRFDPSVWSARLAPAVMVILALALLLSLAIVILSMLGLTPGI